MGVVKKSEKEKPATEKLCRLDVFKLREFTNKLFNMEYIETKRQLADAMTKEMANNNLLDSLQNKFNI